MSTITDLLTPSAGQTGPAAHGSFVLGTVSENAGKDFPGMVKVEFTAWADGMNISKWLPVLCSYAGKEHGQYLIPEVGDIVLVGFMGPMLEHPFVLGSFYPAGASLPKEQYDDKNTSRHMKTKGGVKLTIRDEDGKQGVEAETPKGLRLLVDDEKKTVTVTDKDGKNRVIVDAESGAISLSGDKKISLKAGSCEIIMDGNSGALTLKCDQLKIEAGQTASVKSSNMMTVEAGMLTVEGKQQLALKGGAICEISGGMVKIN